MTNSFEALEYLANLVSEAKTLPAEAPLDIVLQLADANGLFIAAGDALGGSENIPIPYRRHYQQLKLLEVNSVEVLRAFLEQCVANGLPLLTIKSFLPFPYVDSNIDVVAIEAKMTNGYRELLHHLGFVRHRNLADIREPRKEMYYHAAYGESDCTYPKLHLHRSISWNGVVYLDLAQVWQRHRNWDVKGVSVPVPSLEDELLIIAAHTMFENKFITLGELVYLNWLTNHELDWDYIIRTAQTRFWLDALKFFLATACALGNDLRMNMQVEMTLSDSIQFSPISLPLIMPLSRTLRSAVVKLWQDVTHGRLEELPRQLFTYFLVDCLWMYCKARRKATAARMIC
jgi:hypothetical protein